MLTSLRENCYLRIVRTAAAMVIAIAGLSACSDPPKPKTAEINAERMSNAFESINLLKLSAAFRSLPASPPESLLPNLKSFR